MDRNHALTIFNLAPSASREEIERHFEDEAFAVYSGLFSRDPVPSLINAKLKKLEHLQKGWEALSGEALHNSGHQLPVPENSEFPSVQLEAYWKNISVLRSELSNSHSISDAILILKKMSEARVHWDKFWAEYSKPLENYPELIVALEKQVKLSDNVDVMKMKEILGDVENFYHLDFNKGKMGNSQLEILIKERIRSIRILNNSGLNV